MRRQKYPSLTIPVDDRNGDRLFWTIFLVIGLLVGGLAGAYWYFTSPPETTVAVQTE